MEDKKWKSFEDAFRSILTAHKEFFGLESVDPASASVPSESGYVYSVEVVGFTKGDHKLVLFECRRKKRNIEPGAAGEFAFRIETTGAESGYFVTTLDKGLSKGAKMIADYQEIGHIQLSECSTPTDYVMRCANQVFAGLSDTLTLTDKVTCRAFDKDGKLISTSD